MTNTPYYKKTATKSGDTVSYSESTRSIIGLLVSAVIVLVLKFKLLYIHLFL